MNDNEVLQEIVVELRRNRRLGQWVCAVGLIALIALAVLVAFRTTVLSQRSSGPWTAIQSAMSEGECDRALALAKAQTAKGPRDYYGHEYLGMVYLAKGDAARAEKEYARAYELLPSRNVGEILKEIRGRLASPTSRTKGR